MDKASFEIVGNVGKTEFKDIRGGKKIAILSVATSERWKRDDGEWSEKTYWHRIAVFAPAKVERIETMVQKGTRVRLVGQIRPGSYENDQGHTRYVFEFVIGPFGEVEILARAKPREEDGQRQPVRRRGKAAAAGDETAAG
ncbi:MAG: single-stranded DNA-binding protein [Proteobacteria bacterium]|nr:single-stranded DNA-binding protein [Pseudomonadota bacterium]